MRSGSHFSFYVQLNDDEGWEAWSNETSPGRKFKFTVNQVRSGYMGSYQLSGPGILPDGTRATVNRQGTAKWAELPVGVQQRFLEETGRLILHLQGHAAAMRGAVENALSGKTGETHE